LEQPVREPEAVKGPALELVVRRLAEQTLVGARREVDTRPADSRLPFEEPVDRLVLERVLQRAARAREADLVAVVGVEARDEGDDLQRHGAQEGPPPGGEPLP